MSKIATKDVSHSYNTKDGVIEALGCQSLEFPSSSISCIVGSSGCGKSTLLRIIAGFINPTSGHVTIDGEVIEGIHNNVGFVFQNYESTLMPWKNVEKNVRIGAEMRHNNKKKINSVTEDCLKVVGLEDFKGKRISQLSGGMKQRVQVARILAYDPDILLCDEPFGALDAQTKEKLQDTFLSLLADQDVTTIFVTHDIEEAIYLGDFVYVFTEKNPGIIGEKITVHFNRPRFPLSEFESENYDEMIEYKLRIKASLEI